VAASHRLRFLRLVKARLLTIPELTPRVVIGWRHWGEVADDRFPCAFVDSEEVSPPYTFLTGQQIEGLFAFGVWGYAKPVGPFPTEDDALEARVTAREDLLKVVAESLLSDAMAKAINDDLVAAPEQTGVTRLDLESVDTDAGLIEGFGMFRLRCVGRLHVTLGSF